MKNPHITKTAMTFALALSVISGCNNHAAEENQTSQTANTKKIIHTNNGYISGEPISHRIDNNDAAREPVAYNRGRNFYQSPQDFTAAPNDNTINENPNVDQNTGMLYGNPEFNQAAPPPAAPSAPETEQPAPSALPGDAMVQQVVQLTNEQRRQNGIPDLQIDTPLTNMAQEKAQDMLDNNYFSHTSPTYGSPFDMMKTFGISYTTAGENIAKGQQSAQQVVNDWMNSPGHRANILNSRFTHIGVGHTTSEGYWTQEFIAK
ncbi:MAG TPA: CAP domain-containing protein [Bacillus sp. (in: firmicutes)]|nr:CAP domain-containing protein [Bacillus sp. (in: firmicutes)]